MGDFKAHHPLWDIYVTNADANGEEIENILLNNNFCCLNEEDSPIYFSKTHAFSSSMDLSLCSASTVDVFDWHVLDDNFTSDHYPVMINQLSDSTPLQLPKYN